MLFVTNFEAVFLVLHWKCYVYEVCKHFLIPMWIWSKTKIDKHSKIKLLYCPKRWFQNDRWKQYSTSTIITKKPYGDFCSKIHKFHPWKITDKFCLNHQKNYCKITKNITPSLQVHFGWWRMFCSHICKDVHDKNTKPQELVSKARFTFQNTPKKCLKNILKLRN